MRYNQTPPAITLTQAAVDRIHSITRSNNHDGPIDGVRLSVKSGGCSGMSYVLDFADGPLRPDDEKIEDRGAVVYIDSMAFMFVVGTEMDYMESGMKSEFIFNNPNEKAKCGCGESFS